MFNIRRISGQLTDWTQLDIVSSSLANQQSGLIWTWLITFSYVNADQGPYRWLNLCINFYFCLFFVWTTGNVIADSALFDSLPPRTDPWPKVCLTWMHMTGFIKMDDIYLLKSRTFVLQVSFIILTPGGQQMLTGQWHHGTQCWVPGARGLQHQDRARSQAGASHHQG